MESERRESEFKYTGFFFQIPTRMFTTLDEKGNVVIKVKAIWLYGILKAYTDYGKEHCCFATNKYLAKILRCTDRSVQSYLSALRKDKYIKIYGSFYDDECLYIKERFIETIDEKPQRVSGFYEIDENGRITGNEVTKKVEITCKQIMDLYNSTCISLPKQKKTTLKQKMAIKSKLDEYTVNDFENAFEKAEESNFLTGRDSTKGKVIIDFDWLIAKSNMQDVIEGKYDNSNANIEKDIRKLVSELKKEAKQDKKVEKIKEKAKEKVKIEVVKEENIIPPKFEWVQKEYIDKGYQWDNKGTMTGVEHFYNYWEALNWTRKNGKMKDWKQTMRVWNVNASAYKTSNNKYQKPTTEETYNNLSNWANGNGRSEF